MSQLVTRDDQKGIMAEIGIPGSAPPQKYYCGICKDIGKRYEFEYTGPDLSVMKKGKIYSEGDYFTQWIAQAILDVDSMPEPTNPRTEAHFQLIEMKQFIRTKGGKNLYLELSNIANRKEWLKDNSDNFRKIAELSSNKRNYEYQNITRMVCCDCPKGRAIKAAETGESKENIEGAPKELKPVRGAR